MTRLLSLSWIALMTVPVFAWADAPVRSVEHTSSYADQRRVSGGVVAGVGFVTMSGEVDAEVFGMSDSPAPESRQALSGGCYVTAQLDPSWGARLEARYSQRGARAQRSAGGLGGAGGGYEFEFQLAYVQVPLLVTFTLPYDGAFVPYVFAGPELSLLLSSEVSGEGSTTDEMGNPGPSFAEEKDVEDVTGSYDVAATFGAGMKFPLPAGRLVVDARYVISVTEAVGDGETELTPGVVLMPHGLRNHGLLVSAGYEF